MSPAFSIQSKVLDMEINAYSASGPDESFGLTQFEVADDLGPDQVEIGVENCGICHSDLSMKKGDWGITTYPFVGGHEVIGIVRQVGEFVRNVEVGQRVGLGWYSGSCLACSTCLDGDQNLCPDAEGTIVGRYGGFADRVRAQSTWCIPLPDSLDGSTAGPLFCGGITVFNPIVRNGIVATDSVGVVGIGGLGHLALQFLSAWGCEVTAISTNPAKEVEARELGADHFINSRDRDALKAASDRFDLILVTVNVKLEWDLYFKMLRRKGRLHVVGATPPVEVASSQLIEYEKSLTGSPLGSPSLVGKMLEFCARKSIAPVTQHYPMSQINEAFDQLESGQARYRLVLENDFS